MADFVPLCNCNHDFSEEKLRDSVGFNFSQIQAFKLGEKWEEDKDDANTGQATVN